MATTRKLKLFNDPIYGFIRIPNPQLFKLISHPFFQRLRRISQMGMSYLVFPGAHHTRFHHALGSMHLMQQALEVLRYKGVVITEEEAHGLLGAILLHDIGHGPFSHAMEHSLVSGVSHEDLSLLFMEQLNKECKGELNLAIEIFKGSYHKKFLNQLVSSQLDMDRLDYLKRDSFYTGVAEGNINAERLITMLNVVDGSLVVEQKGIYSVEKFLIARRFMYWQVYLHKTGIVAEQLLIRVLRRAREVYDGDGTLTASDSLLYFLANEVRHKDFRPDILLKFASLDDVDILSALKTWQHHPDFILSELSKMILNRQLLKIKVKDKPPSAKKLEKIKAACISKFELSEKEVSYFVFTGSIENRAYNREKENINILMENSRITDVAKASDHLNLDALSKTVTKHYMCYPKKSVS
ncbi:HD domain-containing protein [Muriicola soli]|uniref:HD domain-containing protein n=1 Tax=Muriicola soli TaxID=2507538 RepID=A0A411E935_9FLAO|nr:HD domain-containing protein [Muriicola soli]QBA64226.1 HD domain-containing protein [Muriicola soli]